MSTLTTLDWMVIGLHFAILIDLYTVTAVILSAVATIYTYFSFRV